MKTLGRIGDRCVATAAVAIAVTSLTVGSAHAATVTSLQIAGDAGLEGTGAFSGSISYNQINQQLTIQLLNEASDTGNYIVGFVFNAATDVAVDDLSSAPSNDWIAWTNPDQNVSFGTYEWGAGLDSNPPGIGLNQISQPTRGVAFGDTGTWIFDIIGNDAATTVASDFMSVDSIGNNGIETPFVVRFMGGASDTVPGTTVIVPLPAAAWGGLVLLGMLGVGQTLRKRRLAQQVV
ncbi:MAG: hypothetical protein WD151_01780 [Phycisphaeraceae bacterium]